VSSTCGVVSAFCTVESLPSGASATLTIVATPITNLARNERRLWVSQPAVAPKSWPGWRRRSSTSGPCRWEPRSWESATITNVSGSDVLLLVERGCLMTLDSGCCPAQRVPRSCPATSSPRAPAATSWSASPRQGSSPESVRPEPSPRHCGIRRPESCFPQFRSVLSGGAGPPNNDLGTMRRCAHTTSWAAPLWPNPTPEESMSEIEQQQKHANVSSNAAYACDASLTA
jgi:hypothetical protein